jgi:hypothetical protein
MKISEEPSKEHFFIGAFFVLVARGSLLAAMRLDSSYLPAATFFFDWWRGVALGRPSLLG